MYRTVFSSLLIDSKQETCSSVSRERRFTTILTTEMLILKPRRPSEGPARFCNICKYPWRWKRPNYWAFIWNLSIFAMWHQRVWCDGTAGFEGRASLCGSDLLANKCTEHTNTTWRSASFTTKKPRRHYYIITLSHNLDSRLYSSHNTLFNTQTLKWSKISSKPK